MLVAARQCAFPTALPLLARVRLFSFSSCPSLLDAQAISTLISSAVGSLDDVSAALDRSPIIASPDLVTCVIDSCCSRADITTSRRFLRFFSWCQSRNPNLGPEAFDRAIGAFAQMGDLTAMGIAIANAQKESHAMAAETFALVADTLVSAGKEGEAVRLLRSFEKQQLLPRPAASLAVVHALCAKGHARKAEGVAWHHKCELSAESVAGVVRRSILHGWCVRGNVREARRILDEMKSLGVRPSLPSYHALLRCVCHRNLQFNPSALVSEATDVLSEMRASGVSPTAASFNILLSCLGRVRRVKEAYRILHLMRQGEEGCSPDWVSYYLVVRVLYLTRRFVRGNRLVDQMLKDSLQPGAKFYHGLIGVLCGVEKVDCALNIFTIMRKHCVEENGPTYDLLIAKLCRSGRFEEGSSLWTEAVKRGIMLNCPRHLLDPSKTKVFEPRRSVEKLRLQSYKRIAQKAKKAAAKTKMKKGQKT